MRVPDFHSPSPVRLLRPVCFIAAMLLSAMTCVLAAPTTARAAEPADLCAQVGAQAGFPKNDKLVVAVAVALAESRCDERAQNKNGPTLDCPNGSTDRGLWQINDCIHHEYSVRCAWDPRCNAKAAYRISSEGSDFSAWITYREGQYRGFLDEARAAVGRLGQT
jgi:hypothetical protein